MCCFRYVSHYYNYNTHFISLPVPEVAPSEVNVTANSTSAKVTWSPLPPKFQCGVITYNLRVISENLEVHTARVRNHSYQFLTLQPETLYLLTIRASTEAGEGPATSEQLFITSAVHSTETPPKSTTTPASSVATSTIEQHSATELVSPSHPSSATDETTPSTSGSTHESTTTDHHTSDPTTDVDNNVNSIDSLRVTTDGEPFAMSIAVIAAIALGGTLLVTIVGIIVVCVCVCVYNCRRKRKTYVVNRTISQVPSATNRIFV